jgi:23S rRNA (guanosine2251-2'-O)-methyltransferase
VQLLKTEGVWIIGLAGRTPADIYDLDLGPSLALVLGGEEKGLRPLLKRQCDFLAAVPMDGPLDSLNASVAAAVALYEVRRQRSMAR